MSHSFIWLPLTCSDLSAEPVVVSRPPTEAHTLSKPANQHHMKSAKGTIKQTVLLNNYKLPLLETFRIRKKEKKEQQLKGLAVFFYTNTLPCLVATVCCCFCSFFLLKGGSVICQQEKCPPVKCANPIVDPHVCCPICRGKHCCTCTGAAEQVDVLFLFSL